MLRKILSLLGITAVLTAMIPYTALAVVSVGPTVDKTTFNPVNQTVTVSFTVATAATDVDVDVLDSASAVVRTLMDSDQDVGPAPTPTPTPTDGNLLAIDSYTLTWDGKNDSGVVVADGSYAVRLQSDGVASATIPTVTVVNLTATVDAPASFEPISAAGASQTLAVSYTATAGATVSVDIKNIYGEVVKPFQSATLPGSFTWDGKYSSEYVPAGTYTVTLTATKSGVSYAPTSKSVTVAYNHSNKPVVSDVAMSTNPFDPDYSDTDITFKVSKNSDVVVQIRKSASPYDVVEESAKISVTAGNTGSYTWTGLDDNYNTLPVGSYTINVVARNEFGVGTQTFSGSINDQGSLPTYNADITNISVSPSTFEPENDDEVDVEYDIERDLEYLVVTAKKSGEQSVELVSDTDLNSEENVDFAWDGTNDDGDYVADGQWRIEFKSKSSVSGATELLAAKFVNVEYTEPQIDDIYISKDSLDGDRGEFNYVMFRTDEDALVDVFVDQDGEEDDTITEDMEVDAEYYYAVQFDASDYNDGDDIDLRVVAKNLVNENVSTSKKLAVDIKEDDVSDSKANVTNDYAAPVISEPGTAMEVGFSLEEDAKVTITIHKGDSASGAAIATLADDKSYQSGDYVIEWNGKDKNGDKLSASQEEYSYKIVSDLDSSDTEKGMFLVDDKIGDIEGDVSGGGGDDEEGCAGFSDVPTSSKYCDAITWAKDEGVFEGYNDGTFKPYTFINRVELLKIILEANDVTTLGGAGDSAGFTDVDPYAWYMPYIATAKGMGIFAGDAGRNTARPNDSVNRAEASKFMFETLRAVSGFSIPYCGSNPYPDVSTSAWYAGYVCGAKQYSLFEVVDGNFYPGTYASRGEMALALFRLHEADKL